MLNSLFIKNYRNFKHLEIPHLARVNLIGGKNNVGKTNLLEAVRLYVSHAKPVIILVSLKARDEYFDTWGELEESILSIIRNKNENLFYEEGITIKATNIVDIVSTLSIKLSKFKYEYLLNEETGGRSQISKELPFKNSQSYNYKALKVEWNSVQNLIPINKDFSKKSYNNQQAGSIILGATGGDTKGVLGFWWDKITLTDKEDKVIEILQLIESRIEGISFIKVSSRNDRIPIVRLKGVLGVTPLKSLGDGIYKALRIAIALVNCENQVCLIDEIATGLHYSVLVSLWEMIFETAEKLNIQVFATTHSQDCIKAFAEVWNKRQKEGLYLRLQKNSNEEVVAVSYEEDILLHAAERQIEMR